MMMTVIYSSRDYDGDGIDDEVMMTMTILHIRCKTKASSTF